uniref:Uncharacterized protein n=1 Tax=Acrobeloides nanus TaxID=290746 RepID=A0A914DIG0_9BILA
MVTFFFQLRAYRIYAASDPKVCLNPIRTSDPESVSKFQIGRLIWSHLGRTSDPELNLDRTFDPEPTIKSL